MKFLVENKQEKRKEEKKKVKDGQLGTPSGYHIPHRLKPPRKHNFSFSSFLFKEKCEMSHYYEVPTPVLLSSKCLVILP